MKKTNLKIISALVVVLVCAIFAFDYFGNEAEVKASSGHNIFGFAWSENIGWISFNSDNCDTNDDGLYNDGVTGCLNDNSAVSSYGVSLNNDKNLIGSAWSENVGWISFESDDIAGCPSGVGTCQPGFDSETKEFFGWVRALSYGDGWDGWISLNANNCDTDISDNGFIDEDCGGDDTSDAIIPYEISLSAVNNLDFAGYAWGGDVVGWICFNNDTAGCDPAGNGPDYKVYFSDTPDFLVPPTVDNLATCLLYTSPSPRDGLLSRM